MITDHSTLKEWCKTDDPALVGEWLLKAIDGFESPHLTPFEKADLLHPFYLSPSESIGSGLFTSIKDEAQYFQALMRQSVDYALSRWNAASGFRTLSELFILGGRLHSNRLSEAARNAFSPAITDGEEPFNVQSALTELANAFGDHPHFTLGSSYAATIDQIRAMCSQWQPRHVRSLGLGFVRRQPAEWWRYVEWLHPEFRRLGQTQPSELNDFFIDAIELIPIEQLRDGLVSLPPHHADWLIPYLFGDPQRHLGWRPTLGVTNTITATLQIYKLDDSPNRKVVPLAAQGREPPTLLKHRLGLIANATDPYPGAPNTHEELDAPPDEKVRYLGNIAKKQ